LRPSETQGLLFNSFSKPKVTTNIKSFNFLNKYMHFKIVSPFRQLYIKVPMTAIHSLSRKQL